MGAMPRSWQQQIRQRLVTILLVASVLVVAIVLIIIGYRFDWTGFNGNNKSGKTLWDWMQLLFIPVVLAVAGFWFNHNERRAVELRADNERKAAELRAKTERDIAEDNQRQAALQAYIDKISELLLHEHLGESSTPEVQAIAQARTVTVLRILDPVRRGSLIRFLSQANILMICVEDALVGIDLSGADLTRVNLNKINLEKANLQGTNLREASLQGTNLVGANLQGAILWEADLQGARLDGANLQGDRLVLADLQGAVLWGANLENANLMLANLSRANLSGANLTGAILERANLKGVTGIAVEQLESQAKSLKGATMSDGSIHP